MNVADSWRQLAAGVGRALGVIALLCAGCAAEPEITSLQLELHQLSSCGVVHPESIALEALGDFPSRSAQLQPERGTSVIDDFPIATRELSLRAGTAPDELRGRHLLRTATGPQPVLLLPTERSCPLGDPFLIAPAGAAVAALPGGGFLLAGGRDAAGVVSSDALTLAPGKSLIEQVPAGMLLRRAYASATVVSGHVVVAGGVGDLRAGAHETFEMFDGASASFLTSRSGKLSGPRMQHAAALLPNGGLLLAGGRAEPDGAPLSSADLLDIASNRHSAITGAAGLKRARVAPELLVLDSGSVFVVAGRDERGAVVDSVERFDLAAQRFTLQLVALPTYREVVTAALPGARIAWFGCDSGVAAASCGLHLLLERSGTLASVPVPLEFDVSPGFGLSELRLLALDARRLLLTASDALDPSTRRRAYVIDLNFGRVRRVDASRVPNALLMLENGQVAELDDAGGSLREVARPSPFAPTTGNLVTSELTGLALDAPAHWSVSEEGLQAETPDARVDVPELLFRGFELELELVGDGSLLLLGAAGVNTTVTFAGGTLQVRGCRHQLPIGGGLVVRLERARLSLRASTGAALCDVAIDPGGVRVAVSADDGAQLRKLSLRRL